MATAKTDAMSEAGKINFEGLFAMHKANLETMAEAQQIWANAAYTTLKMNLDFMRDAATKVPGMGTKIGENKDYAAEVKTIADDAMSLVKSGMDVSVDAQSKIAALINKRVSENVEDVKKTAQEAKKSAA